MTRKIDSRQVAGMLKSEQLGLQLAEDHPETADLYRRITDLVKVKDMIGDYNDREGNPLNFYDELWTHGRIASEYLPDATSKHVATIAIIYTMKTLIPEDERKKLARLYLQQGGYKGWINMEVLQQEKIQ